jgi:hypothetical protein
MLPIVIEKLDLNFPSTVYNRDGSIGLNLIGLDPAGAISAKKTVIKGAADRRLCQLCSRLAAVRDTAWDRLEQTRLCCA